MSEELLNTIFRRHKPGDPVRFICDTDALNFVYSVLEDIKGVGCRIEKPTDGGGQGWRIVVDGTSDEQPPDNAPPPWEPATPPEEAYVVTGVTYNPSTHVLSLTRRKALVVWAAGSTEETVPITTAVEESV